MAKKGSKMIKLALAAGAANPAPPVGPALGAAGVNIEGNAAAVDITTTGAVAIPSAAFTLDASAGPSEGQPYLGEVAGTRIHHSGR